MSIKSEIAKSASYLRSARKAILGRGGEISLSAGFKDLPEAIYKIPADASLAYQVDDSVAYRKIVPSGAEEFAQVAKVGGMTYKCNNLIPFPYWDGNYGAESSRTINGVTFTVNADGSVTANGTATENANFFLINTPIADLVEVGKTYTLSGCPFGGGAGKYRINFRDSSNYGNQWVDDGEGRTRAVVTNDGFTYKYQAWIAIFAGYTANNLVFKPMLNEGDVALTFEPYGQLRDTAVTELKSEGANLLDENSQEIILNARVSTKAGGTYSESGYNVSHYIPVEAGSKYKTNVTSYYAWYDSNKAFISGGGLGTNNYLIAPTNAAYLRFDYPQGVDVMLNRGSTALPYSPYMSDTFEIPEALRQFLADKGYGKGVEGYPNYIDFERKVFVKNTYRMVFDGTENWSCDTVSSTTGLEGAYRNKVALPLAPVFVANRTVSNIVCSHYKTISAEQTYYATLGVANNSSSAFVYDDAYNTSDISLWKAHLAELYANGNPLVVEYALATPIETDISAYLGNDSFIAVEGGGSITAVNEYEYDAPSTINYITKVGT